MWSLLPSRLKLALSSPATYETSTHSHMESLLRRLTLSYADSLNSQKLS